MAERPAQATESRAQTGENAAARTEAETPAQTDMGPKLLEGMSILGNQEAPKALVIVPWKSSELGGSLGIAPTANLNPERKTPSMFEPIHGSAFDITGKGIANPVGSFWTAVMMLEHLGEKPAAARLMKAVERVTADPALHTPDLGGKATTKQVTQAVVKAIERENE